MPDDRVEELVAAGLSRDAAEWIDADMDGLPVEDNVRLADDEDIDPDA